MRTRKRPEGKTALSTRDCGSYWESAVESFLHHRGLKTRKRNFHSRFGEIDLIMKHGEDLVFIEVRYRGNSGFGDGAASISASKKAKLLRTARYFLCLHPRYSQQVCRFDVVSVSVQDGDAQFHWIRNALETGTG